DLHAAGARRRPGDGLPPGRSLFRVRGARHTAGAHAAARVRVAHRGVRDRPAGGREGSLPARSRRTPAGAVLGRTVLPPRGLAYHLPSAAPCGAPSRRATGCAACCRIGREANDPRAGRGAGEGGTTVLTIGGEPTLAIDSDAHVIESEKTWSYLEPSEEQWRPVLVGSE